MALKGTKASKIYQRKSRAKAIEWVARNGSRGTRHTPVEVSTSTNEQVPRQDAVGMEVDNHEAIVHEVNPPSMDVDETPAFWTEEPVIPEQRRVSYPTRPSSAAFYIPLSPSALTWKSLFPGSAPICIASSVPRVSQI